MLSLLFQVSFTQLSWEVTVDHESSATKSLIISQYSRLLIITMHILIRATTLNIRSIYSSGVSYIVGCYTTHGTLYFSSLYYTIIYPIPDNDMHTDIEFGNLSHNIFGSELAQKTQEVNLDLTTRDCVQTIINALKIMS